MASETVSPSNSFPPAASTSSSTERSICDAPPTLTHLDPSHSARDKPCLDPSLLPRIITPDASSTPPTTAALSSSSSHLSTASRTLVLPIDWQPSPLPLPLPPTADRNVAAELHHIVEDMLRRKRTAHQALADENAALRAQVAFLSGALANASSSSSPSSSPAPGSGTADVLSALERERTLRVNAEESRAATSKYLAEQVESVSKQKLALERTLRDFTHGREWWKAKAVAALERCEALEAENLMIKTQLNALARKQSSAVAEQVSSVLREVAEERDRLRRLEEFDPSGAKTSAPLQTWIMRTNKAKGVSADSNSKFLSSNVVHNHWIPVR